MDTFELVRELTAAYGPSGREQGVAEVIAKYARPYADEISTDVMGNLTVHKRGEGPRLMLCAHMDTVGLVVTYLEEDGSLRVGRLGGVTPREVRNAPVRFENGAVGAVKAHGKADEDKLTVDDLYLDIGAESRQEAQERVRLGDVAVYAGETRRAGERVLSPYLDDRVACAALLKALERAGESGYDLYFVFSVQEEVGTRGAKTAAYGIQPDYAVAVDVTGAYDYPGAPRRGSSTLGGGAAIKVMDTSVICHPEMVEKLTSLARERGIRAQQDVLTRGGTDAGAIHQSGSGVVTGGVSIPCRHIHTPTEIVDLRDVEASVELLVALIESKESQRM